MLDIKKNSFEFEEILNRFKSREWDLDNFCGDETLAFHLFNHKKIEDTPKQRELYYMTLRKRLLDYKK